MEPATGTYDQSGGEQTQLRLIKEDNMCGSSVTNVSTLSRKWERQSYGRLPLREGPQSPPNRPAALRPGEILSVMGICTKPLARRTLSRARGRLFSWKQDFF